MQYGQKVAYQREKKRLHDLQAGGKTSRDGGAISDVDKRMLAVRGQPANVQNDALTL
jgi:hypothetical protein